MSDTIKFKCACGKSLKAVRASAGKKAKCTRCGLIVRIPQAAANAALAKDFELTPLEELAEVEFEAEPAAGLEAAGPHSAPRAASLPPPLPPAVRAAAPLPASPQKSIWEEEAEYRLGHAVEAGSAGTYLPPVQTPKGAKQRWFKRRKKKAPSNFALQVAVLPLVVGIIALIYGFNERKLADASTAEPEMITLQKLIERGPDGNPNIILTDFQICAGGAYECDAIAGQQIGSWRKVWVPITPRTQPNGAESDGSARIVSPKAVIYSTRVHDESEIEPKLGVPQLRGMVTNRITSLSSSEKKLLQDGYPFINFDRCVIVDEGREPTKSAAIDFYVCGGGVLTFVGAILVIKLIVWG